MEKHTDRLTGISGYDTIEIDSLLQYGNPAHWTVNGSPPLRRARVLALFPPTALPLAAKERRETSTSRTWPSGHEGCVYGKSKHHRTTGTLIGIGSMLWLPSSRAVDVRALTILHSLPCPSYVPSQLRPGQDGIVKKPLFYRCILQRLYLRLR